MASDLEKLQGTWNIVSLEADGHSVPESVTAGTGISIVKNKFKSTGMDASYEGRMEINEFSKPKTFDLVFTAGPEKGNRNLGIYKLVAQTWTLCLATRGSQRPDKFATSEGSGFALETLKRGNPRGESKKQKVRVDVTDSTSSPTELEGEWAMVSAVFNGAPMEENAVKWCKRITRGDVTSVVAGPQVFLKARFTLDLSKNPRHIDYVNLSGPAKGKPQQGIWDIKERVLRICMSPPDQSRPADFSSKPGDGRSYTVWRPLFD